MRWRKLILFLLLLSPTGCNEAILHDLSEVEANRLITRLADAAVQADKDKQPDGRWSISVPSSQNITALRYLEQARLTRGAADKAEPQSALVSSREEQRFQYERGISRQIEQTLLRIDGVLEARVHLNLPPTDPLFGQPIKGAQPGTAGVLIVVAPVSTVTEEQVRGLVSGASGIMAEQIRAIVTQGSFEVPQVSEPKESPGVAAEDRSTAELSVVGISAMLLGLLLLRIGLKGRGKNDEW